MRIHKYGITLTRLKADDLELVRIKRNSQDISSVMQYQEIITPGMQQKWFESINTIYHNYFIIHYQGEKIGLINGKNSDYEKRTSEGGMFVWDKQYWGTIIPAMCSVIMSDHAFLICGYKKNYIKILNSNQKAIVYNKQIGYVPTKDYASDKDVQWFELTKEKYEKHVVKIRKAIGIITNDFSPLTIENIDFKDDSDEEIKVLYKPLPSFIRENIANIILKREGRNIL
ncbi:MAG: GNAT family N-acetyltransferase [Bacteroidia bacterium]